MALHWIGDKSLPEPMIAKNFEAIWHHLVAMSASEFFWSNQVIEIVNIQCLKCSVIYGWMCKMSISVKTWEDEFPQINCDRRCPGAVWYRASTVPLLSYYSYIMMCWCKRDLNSIGAMFWVKWPIEIYIEVPKLQNMHAWMACNDWYKTF